MDEIIVRLHFLDLLIVVLFLGFMIGVGVYFMAGRSLTAPLLVGTLVSTFYGLDTLFGTLEIGNLELWQEYGIIIITPVVLVVYLIANALGKEVVKDEDKEEM